MKKFFAAILTVFLSLGLLTACGGGQQHGASSAPAVQSVERSDTGLSLIHISEPTRP